MGGKGKIQRFVDLCNGEKEILHLPLRYASNVWLVYNYLCGFGLGCRVLSRFPQDFP
jgi:hypothetical protein